jgi:AcrR family transcriptional regulator
MSVSGRKSTQRERILNGMLHASLRHGYAGATVSRTIVHAGVSRPTFYEYFTDRDDCFLSLQSETSARMLDFVGRRIGESEHARALQAAVRALVEFAESEPEAARFVMDEAIAGGPRALRHRERAIAEVARAVVHARKQAPPEATTPDLPAEAVIGGVSWLLAPLLRREERQLKDLADDLERWIDSYLAPTDAHRWSRLDPGPPLAPSPHVSDLPIGAPAPLPPGRPRVSSAEVARNQRDRILYATAIVAAKKGYTATTIADIAQAAALDRRVFYAHFHDKQQAFLAVHEFVLRHTMALAAGAFFSGTSWPERVWEGVRASCQFAAGYPVITRIAFVDSHAVGALAIQRVEDSHTAFTIFLQEGYQNTTQPPPNAALQAIVTTIFEIGHRQALANHAPLMPRFAPHATYVALAPFLGPRAANEFIDAQLRSLELEDR